MSFSFFFLKIRRPPSSPLFPYSTLFRSHPASPRRRHSVVAVVTAVHRLAPHDCDGTTAVPAYLEPTLRQDRRRLVRSEEHTSELSPDHLVSLLLLEKKKQRYSFIEVYYR